MLWLLGAAIAFLLIGYGLWFSRGHGSTRRRGTVDPSRLARARGDAQERMYNDYLPGRPKRS